MECCDNSHQCPKITSFCFYAASDSKPRKMKTDHLLLFLMKLKFGLPFSALASIHNANPRTVSKNFFRILDRSWLTFKHPSSSPKLQTWKKWSSSLTRTPSKRARLATKTVIWTTMSTLRIQTRSEMKNK